MEDKDLEKEAAELKEMSDAYENLTYSTTEPHVPYSPNRAQRRAMAKRDRALQKRNPRV